jgi:Fe-S-cluster containining protein
MTDNVALYLHKMADNYVRYLNQVSKKCSKLAKKHGVTCRKGCCAGCCRLLVGGFPMDGVVVARHLLKDQDLEIIKRVKEASDRGEKSKGDVIEFASTWQPCPFLQSDKLCSIYSIRPLVCRTCMVTSPIELCSDIKEYYPNGCITSPKVDQFIEDTQKKALTFGLEGWPRFHSFWSYVIWGVEFWKIVQNPANEANSCTL